jgi:serine protease AprX
MFSLKNKLSPNLKIAVTNKYYKNYRVIIHCKNMCEKVNEKILSYKGLVIRYIPSIQCVSAYISSHVIERLLEYPQVDYIAFDDFSLLCGSSVLAANGIHLRSTTKYTGKGITIGVVDSGVYPHPDIINPQSKIVKFIDLINELKYPYDDNGHGTFISGLMCGNGYCSKGMYKGIAEDSKIYMIKAFNRTGKGYISDILFSIDTLIKEAEEHNIRVLCLPFELIDNDYFILDLFSNLFEIAISKNIVVVVPSGHNGSLEGSMRGISTLKSCITVSGLDTRSNIVKPCSFASVGPAGKYDKPDLSAACEDICSLKADTAYISESNGRRLYPRHLDIPYTNYSGTSCSAAYIAGVCALYLESNSKLVFKDLQSLLSVSCKLHDISRFNQGAGTVDLYRTLQ